MASDHGWRTLLHAEVCAMKTTEDWVARHVPDTAEAIREALEILERHGYGAGDLDFLLYEGQGGAPGDADPDLETAVGLLGRLREAGIAIR